MYRAAIRRLVLVVLGTLGATAVGSLLVGLLTGSTPGRAVTLGFYLVGCLFLLAGFFLGNRGPARVRSEADHDTGFFGVIFGAGGRRLRWATPSEQDETINSSAVYVVLGIVLVFAGFLVDSRHALF
jgi:tellurite resistance protein TehA-like permease